MTNCEYRKKLDRAAATMIKALTLKDEVEDEYVRRYGQHPSEVDDDTWIDSMTGACGKPCGLTPEEVDESAVLRGLTSYF